MCEDRIPVGVFSRVFVFVLAVAALFSGVRALYAQEKEPLAILQLGSVSEWSLSNGGSSFGPSAAVEVTAIKNWLEIEAGVAPLFRRGQSEWNTSVVFRKPFELSPTVEFEPGIGPVWMHTVSSGRATDAIGTELSFEFMVWPTRERSYGWFVEPSYGYSFGRDHEQSFGVNAGLLIPIR